MLLGLLASFGSTSAWAQYTAVKGVVYGLNDAKDGAIVVGAIPSKLDGPFAVGQKTIEIVETVEIKGATYNVVDFWYESAQKNWKNAGEFKNDPVSGSAGSSTNPTDPGLDDGSEWVVTPGQGGTAPTAQTVYKTEDLTKLAETLDLVIRPATLTEITKEDVVDLPIAGFILAGTSGITNIPETLFAAAQKVRVSNAEVRDAAIAAANAKIKGTTENCLLEDFFVQDGKIGGKQAYLMTVNNKNIASPTGHYLVLEESIKEQVAGEFVCAAYIYAKEEKNGKTTFTKQDKIYFMARTNAAGDLQAYFDNVNGYTGWKVIATKVSGDKEPTCLDGSEELAKQAKKAYEDAVAAEEAARKASVLAAAAVITAETNGTTVTDPAIIARGKAAEALKSAIQAIKDDACFETLQQEVRAQLGTAVDDLTEWFCAYALANNLVETECDWTAKTNAFVKAYYDFYGSDNTAIPAQKITAYKFTSYGATGSIPPVGEINGFVVPSAGITFNQYAMGLVADETGVTSDENPDAKAQGFSRVRVLSNTAEGFADKIYYVKIDPTTKEINPNTYYVLYEYKDGSFKPCAEGEHTVTTTTTDRYFAKGAFSGSALTLTWKTEDGAKSFTSKIEEVTEGTYQATDKRFIELPDGNKVQIYKKYSVQTAGQLSVDKIWCADNEGNIYKWDETTNTTFQQAGDGNYYAKGHLLYTEKQVQDAQTVAAMIMCVKIGASQDYVLVPEPGINPEISAAYPGNDLDDAITAYKPQSVDQLKNIAKKKADEYEKAKQDTAAKKTAWENAEKQLSDDKKELAKAEAIPEYLDKYLYDKDGKNETLLLGAFNNDIVTIGNQAFANCVKAKFTGTFRENLQKIGTQAFMNTLFENLDLSNTGKKDWRGAKDEDGNDIPDGEIDIKDRLTSADIADNAFYGTPMVSMLLDATNLGDGWVYNVARNIKFESVDYTVDCKTSSRVVNQTLTTVTLPEGEAEGEDLSFDRIQGTILGNEFGTFQNCVELTAIRIPAQVYQIEPDAFNGCDKLAKITFASSNSELERIGARAFQGTAAEKLNLTKQTLLGTADQSWTSIPDMPVGIGDYAFAYMTKLTVVNVTNTQLTSLPAHVFYGDALLSRVTFFDATDPKSESVMATLPARLFETNIIKNLDLSRTQVKNLTNLFYAGPGDKKATDPCGNEYVSNPINKTLESIILPENLETIECFALSSLQNDNFKKVVIPSTVTWMGDGVFYNDAKLEEVICEETQLSGFYAHTFGQCASLKKVVFLSVNGAIPCKFGQPVNGEITWNTYWNVQGGVGRGGVCYDDDADETKPGVNFGFGDNLFFSCGSKLVEVVVTTSDVEVLMPAAGYSWSETNKRAEGSYSFLNDSNAGIELKLEADLNGEHYYWDVFSAPYGSWFDSTQGVVIYSAYQMGNDIVLYPAKIKGPGKEGWYKVAAFNPNLSYTLPTYNAEGVYTGTATITGNDPAAVCIIRSTTKTVYPKFYTDQTRKYQTTLDVENILSVARTDIDASTNLNYYSLAANGKKLKFIHRNTEGDVILKGKVIVKTETEQGYGARDFFNVVVVEPNEATAILGVKEYMNSNQNGAIYNLNGIRVSTPQKGQMYIQNGKKFIQK